ncbi:hypothetical protein J8J17_20735, partial [Mycobacterium tuberculosis]|nr:hypothetical protein [Mycobacterium tuberculosis]
MDRAFEGDVRQKVCCRPVEHDFDLRIRHHRCAFGDPVNAPIGKPFDSAYDQTSWDTPSLVNAGLKQARSGAFSWITRWFT